jgi:hypothetical protein
LKVALLIEPQVKTFIAYSYKILPKKTSQLLHSLLFLTVFRIGAFILGVQK